MDLSDEKSPFAKRRDAGMEFERLMHLHLGVPSITLY